MFCIPQVTVSNFKCPVYDPGAGKETRSLGRSQIRNSVAWGSFVLAKLNDNDMLVCGWGTKL